VSIGNRYRYGNGLTRLAATLFGLFTDVNASIIGVKAGLSEADS
jgi:hypothetical protein